MRGDALDIGFLADEERNGLRVGGHVGDGIIAAHTTELQGRLFQPVNLLVIQTRYISTYRVTRVELGAFLANFGTGVALGRAVGAYLISILLFEELSRYILKSPGFTRPMLKPAGKV